MRPSVFKAPDEYNRKQADFAAWCKRRQIATDDWITLSGRDANGDKHGGARVLLDDDGAIVYGLGGGHAGKKLGEALTDIKRDAAAQRGQGTLFSDFKSQARKEQKQARAEKAERQKQRREAQKASTEARKTVEKLAGLKIAPGDAAKSEQYAKEYGEKNAAEPVQKLSEITSKKKLMEQFNRYYNGAEMRVEAASNSLMRERLALPGETPERHAAFREAYYQMKRSTKYYQAAVKQAYETRLRQLEQRRRRPARVEEQEADIPF